MSSPFPARDDSEATQRANIRRASALPVQPGPEPREISKFAAANPMLAAANPLLMMLQTLRTASAPGSVSDLRVKLIDAVKEFDAACERLRISELERGIANYALCTVVDECAQMTPWGVAANWASQSLLLKFHHENWGGEKFFEFLNRMMASAGQYLSLLELYYVCLSLGFMGRFNHEGPGGHQTVADLREQVYEAIRRGRPPADRTLSSSWEGLRVAQRRFRGFGLVAALLAVLAVVCLGVFVLCWWALGSSAQALELERLSLRNIKLTPQALAPAAKPRLAKLLAAEIANNQLEVRDLALESVVTLLGERMFDVGSVTPTSAAGPLIDKVADALKQVEGKIVVVGYTDNVPIRTLRFESNYALSKERAATVARVLGAQLGSAERINFEGNGEESPVSTNDTAEGRARNRRVEIVLKSVDAVR